MSRRKASEVLLSRLREELSLDLPQGTRVQRNYLSRWQKEAGAWAWFLAAPDGVNLMDVGSPDTVLECARAPKLVKTDTRWNSIEIHAELSASPQPPSTA